MRMSAGLGVLDRGAAGQMSKRHTDAVLLALDAVEALIGRGDGVDELLGVEVPGSRHQHAASRRTESDC